MSRHVENIVLPADLSVFDEIIDARSPGEYAEDRISGAVNLPVLNDAERAEVGTIYKQVSAFDARKMGAALVSRNIAQHLETHLANKPRDYRALVYCWRGGQRSGSLATVMNDVGWDVTLISGGYKAYRALVVEVIETKAPALKLVVLNGYTGAGKTLLLAELDRIGEQVIDLEGMANHKGSVFGGDPHDPQPAQKHFESLIYEKLKQIDLDRPVYIEAESAKIGRLNLPNPLWQELKSSPVIEVDSPVEARAEYLAGDYEEWIGNLDRVHETIDRLSGFHSKATLARWKTMTEAGEWHPFVSELLTEHYDNRYTVDGSGNYPVPSATVPLKKHDESAIKQTAAEIARIGPTLLR